MNITVIGSGYVGGALAVLLSQKHDVYVLDKNEDRVKAIKDKRSPISDSRMDEILQTKKLRISATTMPSEAMAEAKYIVVATNTQLDPITETLDTSSIIQVMEDIATYSNVGEGTPVIVIKSTVPTGFTSALKACYPQFKFLFCPEFLREKTAMEDMLNPSRIIIGYDSAGDRCEAESFADILLDCMTKSEIPLLYTSTAEAEAIKLFANSYLALRIAYFNELDTFAIERGLDSARIIKGVCLDPRIGDFYNVPGPGFGGHCLPKDTRQLIADFKLKDTPELLVHAALEENEIRKAFSKSFPME